MKAHVAKRKSLPLGHLPLPSLFLTLNRADCEPRVEEEPAWCAWKFPPSLELGEL